MLPVYIEDLPVYPETKDHQGWIKQTEQELYAALEALESGNLPMVRSSAARAQNYVTLAWRTRTGETGHG